MTRKRLVTALLEQHSRTLLLVALIGGAALRWFQIGEASFWYDEAFSVLTARLSLAQIWANVALDVHPPGYYTLLSLWMSLGEGEAMVRSLSAVFSVGAIALTFGLGRWLFDPATGTVAALLMAIAPFQVYFAQEARMYGLVIFLAAALLWLFSYAVLTGASWRVWLAYALTATVGLYVHYFIGFLLVGMHGWLLFRRQGWRGYIWRLVGANVIIGVLFLPQVGQALSRATYYLNVEAWQAPPNLLSPLTTLYYLLFTHRAPIWLAPFAIFLTLVLLVLTAWESRHRPDADKRAEVLLWASIATPIVLVAIISTVSQRSIYVERSFAVVTPALLLLLARGALASPRRSPTLYLAVGLVLAMVVTLGVHYATPDPAKPPLGPATAVVEAGYQPGDVSLHLQDASALPALWYGEAPHLLADVPGAQFIFDTTHEVFGGDIVAWPEAVAEADRFWLTVMPGFIGPEQQAAIEAMQAAYPCQLRQDWQSVRVYRCEGGAQ